MGRYSEELGMLASQAGASIRKADDDEAGAWERIADFSRYLTLERGFPIILKASLPIAACEEFLERAGKEARAQKCELAGLVQLGAGVVEVGLKPAEGTQPALRTGDPGNRTLSPAFIAFIERLRQSARDLGGSLTVQRCPLELKSQIDVWGPVGDDFEMMRKLKAALDPKGILSPGRFAGGL
jgi:glycolate oxidase FAD binding subunit